MACVFTVLGETQNRSAISARVKREAGPLLGDEESARMVTIRMWTLNTNTQAGNKSSSQGMTPTVRSSTAALT
jgi:hypothetical protein